MNSKLNKILYYGLKWVFLVIKTGKLDLIFYDTKYYRSDMENFKVNRGSDNRTFIETRSYRDLLNKLKTLKTRHGRIIHVVGAPGTGKSSNIYAAIEELGLNCYDLELGLMDLHADASQLMDQVYHDLKIGLDAGSKSEIYHDLASFDALVIADKFHDTHLMNTERVGYSLWTKTKGMGSLKFYLLCMKEYLLNRKKYNEINIVIQTAWSVKLKKEKKDLFTDFGILSRFTLGMLSLFFEVVEIRYTREETVEIVKSHVDADQKIIEYYIDEIGNKPRLVCQAIESEC